MKKANITIEPFALSLSKGRAAYFLTKYGCYRLLHRVLWLRLRQIYKALTFDRLRANGSLSGNAQVSRSGKPHQLSRTHQFLKSITRKF